MTSPDSPRDRAQPLAAALPEFSQGNSLWPVITSGTAAAVALFTVVIPALSRHTMAGPFLQRYFSGHPLQQFTTLIFCIGISIPIARLLSLRRQRRAVQTTQQLALQSGWPSATAPDEAQQQLTEWLTTETSTGLARTFMGERLHQLLQYVSHRRGNAVAEHLRYLAELSVDQLNRSYQLVRTVTWAVPIVGFLGTVIGITMAIANVTPEQLDSSLPEVTSGLAVAFDTTAQALGLSLLLVFSTFLAERSEQNVLSDVEQFGIDVLLPTFSSQPGVTGQPGAELNGLVREQLNSWAEAFATLQQNWQTSLLTQTESLSRTLVAETEQTLQQHRDHLELAENHYAEVLRGSSEQLATQFRQSVDSFTGRMETWQNALLTSSRDAAAQTEELHRLGRTMLQLTEAEERLAILQQQLNHNFESARISESLEQAISSLNAAVAMLSSRVSNRAAA